MHSFNGIFNCSWFRWTKINKKTTKLSVDFDFMMRNGQFKNPDMIQFKTDFITPTRSLSMCSHSYSRFFTKRKEYIHSLH